MKSITIHKGDDELMRRIQAKARKDGTSLNRAIKALLRNTADRPGAPYYRDRV